MLLILLLAACGAVTPSPLYQTVAEPAGEHCPDGGAAVQSGVDDDGDGVLDADEVDSTTYVCAAAAGADGADGNDGSDGDPGSSTLITTSAEPAGEHCAHGGARLDAGVDDDGDGVLDAEEIDQTSYVCDGADGAPGRQTLVAISADPSGDHCPYGGSRVDLGADLDGDGTLDADEVTDSAYLCDGTDGTAGSGGASTLVSLADEPAGEHCASGGVAVSLGADDDGDGVLDDEEIDEVTYACNGGDGADSDPWLAGTVVIGDYSVSNSVDAALLEGVEQITGTLSIDGVGMGEVSLPDVVTVGDLVIGDADEEEDLEVDAISMPSLTTVEGDLSIHLIAITDSSGLDALRSVGGDVVVSTSGSTGFSMLDGLSSVGGSIEIDGYGEGAELGGFAGMTSYDGDLEITVHGTERLSAFPALETVQDLVVSGPSMTEMTGFSALTTVTGTLTLDDLAVPDLTAFSSLRTVDDDLLISSLTAATDLHGLEGLGSVGDRLYVASSAITSLEGLEGLTSVDRLYILENVDLLTFDGLENLDIDEDGVIEVMYNTALMDISALSNVKGALSYLEIDSTSYLTSLHGLEGVTTIGWPTYVSPTSYYAISLLGNWGLTTLDGLDGVTELRYGRYYFVSDSGLCASAITAFKARFPTAPGTWTVGVTDSGC